MLACTTRRLVLDDPVHCEVVDVLTGRPLYLLPVRDLAARPLQLRQRQDADPEPVAGGPATVPPRLLLRVRRSSGPGWPRCREREFTAFTGSSSRFLSFLSLTFPQQGVDRTARSVPIPHPTAAQVGGNLGHALQHPHFQHVLALREARTRLDPRRGSDPRRHRNLIFPVTVLIVGP